MKIKNIILKTNKLLFRWYYKRCGEHFSQYTFLKSVKLLIENYDWLVRENEATKKLSKEWYDKIHVLEKEMRNIKMNQIATENQIDWANKNFGTDYKKPSEN